MKNKVIITAAMSGAGTFKQNNPAVPYAPEEFAAEAEKAYKAGAAMVHVHARGDNGIATHEIDRIKATHDAIKERIPELIVNLSSAVGPAATPEQRIEQIIAIKPEMASLNTNTMNFAVADRKGGNVLVEFIFTNTFAMFRDFGKAMEENGVKPEIEVYDIGGLDNFLLIRKQGIFTEPYNVNFVWSVAGGQAFRPDAFVTMVNSLPGNANFTACGIGHDQFFAGMQSCILGGHIRVGLEDNVRMPNGELAKGSYEQVEWAAEIVRSLGKEPATPDEAREIMGLAIQG
ncbi:MAG: 3-keto-5-aminohexanoate cleavage protein [Spirochaetae bacterium HGW-Spirochaetae-1]|jgi:3-keto-5-aminohexanoate cleavage enzyme|nr:MAG: 3-keto-5-aminohexanoate cleavage protein [Spirochaetae bacterium HGW-Spirochaetae-1]